jgi:hypothetical protein
MCPKCTETRLRASVTSKHFPGLYARTPVLKGREEKAKGRVRLEGMERREWEGKKMKGRGRKGGREGGRIVKAGAP